MSAQVSELDVVFSIEAQDDFQAKLNYDTRFRNGYQCITCDSLDEAWAKVEAWDNRKMRELNVSIKLTEHLREHVGELKSELLREQYTRLFAKLDEAKEAMLPGPGQSLAA